MSLYVVTQICQSQASEKYVRANKTKILLTPVPY